MPFFVNVSAYNREKLIPRRIVVHFTKAKVNGRRFVIKYLNIFSPYVFILSNFYRSFILIFFLRMIRLYFSIIVSRFLRIFLASFTLSIHFIYTFLYYPRFSVISTKSTALSRMLPSTSFHFEK